MKDKIREIEFLLKNGSGQIFSSEKKEHIIKLVKNCIEYIKIKKTLKNIPKDIRAHIETITSDTRKVKFSLDIDNNDFRFIVNEMIIKNGLALLKKIDNSLSNE